MKKCHNWKVFGVIIALYGHAMVQECKTFEFAPCSLHHVTNIKDHFLIQAEVELNNDFTDTNMKSHSCHAPAHLSEHH